MTCSVQSRFNNDSFYRKLTFGRLGRTTKELNLRLLHFEEDSDGGKRERAAAVINVS